MMRMERKKPNNGPLLSQGLQKPQKWNYGKRR
jgi:hypothetical protein